MSRRFLRAEALLKEKGRELILPAEPAGKIGHEQTAGC
jgi:hypothetical protein